MNERDAGYLYDMLSQARTAARFIEGKDRGDLDTDELLQHALVRVLSVVGEAARHVSDEVREAHPEIPWSDITGMRHRLVHDYLHVDLDRVWEAATDGVSELIPKLEAIVPDPDEFYHDEDAEES